VKPRPGFETCGHHPSLPQDMNFAAEFNEPYGCCRVECPARLGRPASHQHRVCCAGQPYRPYPDPYARHILVGCSLRHASRARSHREEQTHLHILAHAQGCSHARCPEPTRTQRPVRTSTSTDEPSHTISPPAPGPQTQPHRKAKNTDTSTGRRRGVQNSPTGQEGRNTS
jgi:hypothetical protein